MGCCVSCIGFKAAFDCGFCPPKTKSQPKAFGTKQTWSFSPNFYPNSANNPSELCCHCLVEFLHVGCVNPAHNLKFSLDILAYQPVLPHGPIRINIKIKHITNNYNFISHALFHLWIILTRTLEKCIYHYLVAIDLILHYTSICIWYIFNWTIYLWIGILISSIIHINTYGDTYHGRILFK